MTLFFDDSVSWIVVEHRGRLARCGVQYLEAALSATGGSVVVLGDSEVEHDLVCDGTEVLTGVCVRF